MSGAALITSAASVKICFKSVSIHADKKIFVSQCLKHETSGSQRRIVLSSFFAFSVQCVDFSAGCLRTTDVRVSPTKTESEENFSRNTKQ